MVEGPLRPLDLEALDMDVLGLLDLGCQPLTQTSVEGPLHLMQVLFAMRRIQWLGWCWLVWCMANRAWGASSSGLGEDSLSNKACSKKSAKFLQGSSQRSWDFSGLLTPKWEKKTTRDLSGKSAWCARSRNSQVWSLRERSPWQRRRRRAPGGNTAVRSILRSVMVDAGKRRGWILLLTVIYKRRTKNKANANFTDHAKTTTNKTWLKQGAIYT